jgi:DNA-binding MurR/RpiR family transcriptional regulator
MTTAPPPRRSGPAQRSYGDTSTITAQLRARIPALTPSGQRIGNTILSHPLDIIHMTVTDLADRTGSSVATVVRFCQDIGLKGFADLKIRLAAESIPAERGLHEDVAADDTPAAVLDKILHSTARAITDAAGTVDHDSFNRAVRALTGTGRLLIVAVGTSSPLAQDAAYRFRTAGLITEAPLDPHVQHVTARLLEPGAVCLAISHTGQTRETLASAAAAKQAGASTIALTSFYRSPLTKIVDTCLVAGSRETSFRVEAMSSRIIHSTVLDALYVAVCLAKPGRAQASQQITAEVLTEHRI